MADIQIARKAVSSISPNLKGAPAMYTILVHFWLEQTISGTNGMIVISHSHRLLENRQL